MPFHNIYAPRCYARNPLEQTRAAGDPPVWIFSFIGEPAEEVLALVGPIGVAIENAAGARLNRETSAKAKAREPSGTADARRILRQSVLIGANLQAQASR